MNKIKALCVACLVGIATMASAQSTDSRYVHLRRSRTADQSWNNYSYSDRGWVGLRVAYNQFSLDFGHSWEGSRNIDFDGVTVGFENGISLSRQTPIYFIVGANFAFNFGDNWDSDYKIISLNIPLNLGYKVDISDDVSFLPYIGLNLRYHLWGEEKYFGDKFDIFGDDVYYYDDGSYEEEWDANRFQIGWQAGFTFNINHFNIGISYGTDFVEFCDDVDSSTFAATVGFNF